MTFAEKLRDARKRAKIKTVDVNRKLGIDRAELYRYEKGERIPYYNNFLALSQMYGLSLDDFISLLEVRTVAYPDSRLENIEFSSDNPVENILKVLRARGMTDTHFQELIGADIIKQRSLWRSGQRDTINLGTIKKIIDGLCLTQEEVALVLCYDYEKYKLHIKPSYELE